MRIDQAVAKRLPNLSRSRLQQWIRAGALTVNGRPVLPRLRVVGGECVVLVVQEEDRLGDIPERIPLDVVYEDEDLLVVNKPAGLVVHPGAGNPAGTMVNALLYHEPRLSVLPRAGIVHRLDKDTSGLMVVAKTLETHNYLVKELHARRVRREYEAVVVGQLVAGGSIAAPIGRDSVHRTRMAVTPRGKEAVTHYRVIERFPAHTYLRLTLETGRTHQIRVHMAYIRHPIVGDPRYGGRRQLPPGCNEELKVALLGFKRQALHAFRLGLTHPVRGQWVQWEVELPADMALLLDVLRRAAAHSGD